MSSKEPKSTTSKPHSKRGWPSTQHLWAKAAADQTRDSADSSKVEILPPTWGIERPITLQGGKEGADYLGWPVRRVYRDCECGRLPHWTEGKNQLRFNTGVLDLHRYLPQVYNMLGRKYGPEDIVKCLPLYTMAMQGVRPTIEDIVDTLVRAGLLPSATLKEDE